MKCLIATVILAAIGLASARADDAPAMPLKVPQAYTQECAACHTAYPPSMLPARSWRRIMGRLDQHFGSDASLDAATVTRIGQWLQTHAGSRNRWGEEPPQDRITRSAWFAREHRNIEPAVWKHPGVKSAANCAACHARADQGRFDDDNLRFPPGLDARLRRAWND